MFIESVGLFGNDSPDNKYIMLSYIYRIFALIEAELSHNRMSDENYNKLLSAIEYINRNLSEDLNESLLAELTGYSVGYFRRAFNKHIGIAPSKYIMNRRMERAATMLKSGFFNVGEVASAVGFNSIYYFSSAFKSHFGYSPKKAAELFKESSNSK